MVRGSSCATRAKYSGRIGGMFNHAGCKNMHNTVRPTTKDAADDVGHTRNNSRNTDLIVAGGPYLRRLSRPPTPS